MRLVLSLCLLLLPALVSAQTKPVIPVLGVGNLAFELVDPADAADAASRTIKVYVDERPAVVVPNVCTGTAAPFTCRVPLSLLNLTARHTIAVTQTIAAPDGEVESDVAEAPFDLRKVAKPATLRTSSIRVQPGP